MAPDATARRRQRVHLFRAGVYGVTTLLIAGIAIGTTVGPVLGGRDVGANVLIFVLLLLIASFVLFRCALAWRRARGQGDDG